MGVFSRLVRRFGKVATEKGVIESIAAQAIFQKHNIDPRQPVTRGFIEDVRQHSTVFRSVADAIADYVSQVPLNVFGVDENGFAYKILNTKDAKQIRWLNPNTTQQQFVWNLVSDYAYYNGFCFAVVRNVDPLTKDAYPAQIFHIPMGWVKLRVDSKAPKGIAAYVVEAPDKAALSNSPLENLFRSRQTESDDGESKLSITMLASEVCFFSETKDSTNFHPLSKIGNLLDSINAEGNARNLLRRYYKTAPMFLDVFESDNEISTDELPLAIEELMRPSVDRDRGFSPLVLGSGFKHKRLQTSSLESGISANTEMITKDACAILGLPYGLLTGEGNDVEKLEYLFWTRTGSRIANLIANEFANFIFASLNTSLDTGGKGRPMTVDVEGKKVRVVQMVVKPDFSQVEALKHLAFNRAKVDVAYLAHGVVTPDEVRKQLGKPPHPPIKVKHPVTKEEVALPFGELPSPAFKVIASWYTQIGEPESDTANGVSGTPSLSTPGVEGGRDQTPTGEAEMVDTSGQKSAIDELVRKELEDALGQGIL